MSAKVWTASAAAVALLALAPRAEAAVYVLGFGDAVCGGAACLNYQPIDQSYGDVAGLLDVRTRSDLTLSFDGPGAGVKYSAAYFANAEGPVAYGGTSDDGGVPEIQLIPLGGATVKLLSVRLVPASSFGRTSEMQVVDIGSGASLYLERRIDVNISAPVVRNFAFESAQGISFRWGPNGYNVGLDSITFEVTAPPPPPPSGTGVPEPAAWATMIAGFGAVGAMLRARRRRVV